MASKHAISSLRPLCSKPSSSQLSCLSTLTRHTPQPLCHPSSQSAYRPQRHWKSTSTSTSSAPVPPNTATPTPSSSPPTATKPPIKSYSYSDILTQTLTPSPTLTLIDVRTPRETAAGIIPSAQILNITANPDGLFLTAEEFEERFGWEKPGVEHEVVFYCKAGVRSRVAARMAREAGWRRVGEFVGSWDEWVKMGGGGGGEEG